MKSALIGHSGFVGGNLASQFSFDDRYRSRDIDSIRGRQYDLVVCAGAPAVKWKANQEPEADRAALQRLMKPLEEVEAGQFILVSTIDVYERPIEVTEATPADARAPYGAHRRLLEEFVARRFPRHLIARLPALFGPGLKKNVLYDLLHENQVEKINPASVFQYLDLASLWGDLKRAQEHGLALVNLVSEPVSTREVARRAFGRTLPEQPGQQPARYDVRSLHAGAWGGEGGYLRNQETILAGLTNFVARARSAL